MKFGVEFVPMEPMAQIAEYTALAEKRGFSFVWVTDHYNNRDVFVTLALAALKTEKISLGIGLTNPYTRSPAVIASSTASIDEVSGGRAILGMGAGDKMTLENLGIVWQSPVAAIKESVEVIRKLLAGERVAHEGSYLKVKNAKLSFNPSRTVPIYVGAQGPVMLKTAGEVADGILINASHPKDFAVAIERIEAGAKGAGRSVKDIDVVAYTSFSIDDDPNKAKKEARKVAAFVVTGAPPQILERHSIKGEDVEKIKASLEKGDFKGAFGAVTDEMLEVFSVSGPPNVCVEKLAALSKVGVTQIVMGSPLGSDKKKALELIGEKVIPSL